MPPGQQGKHQGLPGLCRDSLPVAQAYRCAFAAALQFSHQHRVAAASSRHQKLKRSDPLPGPEAIEILGHHRCTEAGQGGDGIVG